MTATSAKVPIFTIGYEQVTQPAVIDALAEAGVALLVDIRAVAASRRPGFSKRQLAAGVAERGIDYLHLRKLGTPAEGRLAARTGRWNDLKTIYDAHLETPEAIAERAVLTDIVRSGRPICLLCFERHPEHCHRNILAGLVCDDLGVGVEHLFASPI
ncbi:Protein of unknown function, DUF488 [Pseudoxanthobacter soli DSM 19599]|uniref:DUF488 domain-containing protein n=1 Tax=Pseudoxanthobacter soli DSM 19599 TaxID=1123029 RepID=A0A1M7Z7Q8_9HYPH|nr:DUF488 domain-containing protein [Pseudoxanthobacter soli]SHO60832.1 Protein of unknown function, DUF488 [Pseudoxanthobacter soli DSM 19599]